mmetsp:Transcript_21773/g.40648  ORF Transcript_21773/g.40648 Transcript_21773/m.40648 type:complete len:216 (+) Transcript_21773:206-853(+)
MRRFVFLQCLQPVRFRLGNTTFFPFQILTCLTSCRTTILDKVVVLVILTVRGQRKSSTIWIGHFTSILQYLVVLKGCHVLSNFCHLGTQMIVQMFVGIHTRCCLGQTKVQGHVTFVQMNIANVACPGAEFNQVRAIDGERSLFRRPQALAFSMFRPFVATMKSIFAKNVIVIINIINVVDTLTKPTRLFALIVHELLILVAFTKPCPFPTLNVVM